MKIFHSLLPFPLSPTLHRLHSSLEYYELIIAEFINARGYEISIVSLGIEQGYLWR